MCDIPYSVYAGGKKPLSLGGLDINEVPKKGTGNTLEGSNIYSVDGRIGIGVTNPEEDLELDGNIQLDTGGVQRGRVIFYDKQNDHEHAEIDGLGVGTNGGALAFYTKEDGGSVTEKMRISENGNLTHTGTITNTGSVGITSGSNLTLFSGDIFCSSGTLNSSAVSTSSITTTTLTCNSSLSAQTFAPTYSVLPSLTGKIGQVVDAGNPAVTLVVNNLIQVRSLTIPYTGVWLIGMSLYLGNASNLPGDIRLPTVIRINGNATNYFYGTNITGVNGIITRNLSVNDVVTFNTYLSGSGSTGMTANQRAVYGITYTFLTATRIA